MSPLLERAIPFAAIIITVLCLGSLAGAAVAGDRDAAREYALDWDGSARNPNYTSFSGADCANFVSQCFHAHDHKDLGWRDGLDFVPFTGELDSVGVDGYYQSYGYGWYMFYVVSPWSVWTYTGNWAGANALHYYFRDSAHFDPYRSLIGTYDFDGDTGPPSPPRNESTMTYSDVVSYDFHKDDNGGEFNAEHVVFVVRNNAHTRYCYPELFYDDAYQGDLISSHTTNRAEVLWTFKDVYLWPDSLEYDPTARAEWKLAAWRLASSCD